MATESGVSAPESTAAVPKDPPANPKQEGGEPKKQTTDQPKGQPKAQAKGKAQAKDGSSNGAQPAAPGAPKELTNAEKKKLAKEEKATRRAQSKVVQAPQQPQGGPAAGDAKGAKAKPRQDGHQQQARQGQKGAPVATPVVKEVRPTVPECFSHLSVARRMEITQADKDVHPAVLKLGQYMSTFVVSDSITRLETTLLAFKQVVDSYTTPHGNTFSRHFTSHVLNPQIEYLTACRPMCFSMGNAIRWLKLQISKLDIDLPDLEAKKLLCESIDNFISERINLADFVIVKTTSEMIEDSDVILTYAQHHLVERSLLQAHKDGKRFKVILIDDPYERVGLKHSQTLASAGIPVSYCSDMGALRSNLSEATLVLVAAEAMFSNGAMYARSGTADIVTVASDLCVRVVALCETINFTERVSIDSLTYNEIDPERNSDEGFRLLFDTTRDEFISVVVTELGNHSARSVPAILRKLEEL